MRSVVEIALWVAVLLACDTEGEFPQAMEPLSLISNHFLWLGGITECRAKLESAHFRGGAPMQSGHGRGFGPEGADEK
jgi:hypothetical protein